MTSLMYGKGHEQQLFRSLNIERGAVFINKMWDLGAYGYLRIDLWMKCPMKMDILGSLYLWHNHMYIGYLKGATSYFLLHT